MEGHHREWWQVPAGESPVTMISDRVLDLFFRLFLLVVIEFHRTDITIVFASSFISTICVLNSRKVMPRILKKPKKINI